MISQVNEEQTLTRKEWLEAREAERKRLFPDETNDDS